MNSMIRLKAVFVFAFGILLLISSVSKAQEDELKALLKRPCDLKPKYQAGDKDYYHMKTIYRTMNDSGRVASTQVFDGYYCREVIRIEKDERFDRFEWKYVKKGWNLRKGEIKQFEIIGDE